jgi:hypothetical protein
VSLVDTVGALTNTGTINILSGTAGGARQLTAELNNQGTLAVNTPATFSGRNTSTNGGVINVSGGTLIIDQAIAAASLTNAASGVIYIGGGRTVAVSGIAFSQSGTFGGAGSLTFTSDTVTLGADTTVAVSVLTFNAATINGTATLINPNAGGQTLTFVNSTVNAPLVNQGLLVFQGPPMS